MKGGQSTSSNSWEEKIERIPPAFRVKSAVRWCLACLQVVIAACEKANDTKVSAKLSRIHDDLAAFAKDELGVDGDETDHDFDPFT